MPVTFSPLKISPATFATVRSLLSAGVGFFSDGPYDYVVADSDSFRFDVVQRTASITWSDTVKALPTAFKAVVNGGYFSGSKLLYLIAQTGVLAPTDVDSDGDVKKGGAVVLPDDGKGASYFFFGRDNATPPKYIAGGPGNPSGAVFEGMGGLGPLILPNPATGAPLKFGAGNKYASDPKKLTPPVTPAEQKDCVQRNNNTYASMQPASAAGTGFCVVAAVPSSKLLVMVIKRNNLPGDLDTLRDALFAVGCTVACFTDGASSACLAVNGEMQPGMAPISTKDNLIETGFGLFLYKLPPPTKVKVTFTEIKVFDDASTLGAGDWTLAADVQGTSVSLLKTEVNTGDVISLSPATNATVVVPPGAELTITTSGQDTAGLDDDLGTATARFGAASAPAFGVGAHTLLTSFYNVSYNIAIVP